MHLVFLGLTFAGIMNVELLNPLAEAYAEQFSGAQDELLQEIAAYTYETHPHAHMLSGKLQGQLLCMLSSMVRPSRILEIGTFTGYSALCLAKGLSSDGLLYTIELREEDALKALAFFNKSTVKDRIKLQVGNALDIIPALNESWDMVFIDADKVNYISYYEMVLPQLKQGGFIVADNVLFHGRVLGKNIEGKNAKAIHAFNTYVKQDSRVEQVLLTVRDGLMLIMKK
ncbi:O-methyltransferase [Agriterribacter sp.]|uniref:O-methyltransferase n=1 Tax=Agriterribacter sp. TaxID=2821509 RepID=UPI002BC01A49|nr:O-methyltransferase [Agriterribacter sp.]HTN05806.1 O-methyltransferase [Agriterribacter sp.]